MKFIKTLILVLGVSSLTFGQETIKMRVKEAKVPCVGVAPTECMVVKIGKSKEWTNFYSSIEGFDYEPGYTYRLKVIQNPNKNAHAADASAYTYQLKKIVCKKKVKSKNKENTNQTFTFENKRMYLTQINGKNISHRKVYATFNKESSGISGQSGCNVFNAAYTLEGNTIVLKSGMGTMMACDEESMQLEHEFLNTLTKAYTLKESQNELQFLDPKSGEVVLKFHIPTENDMLNFINGKKWKLIQMDHVGQDYGKAFIQFDVNEKRVNGNGGCNNFFGSYTIDGNQIKFGAMGSTKMACLDEETSQTEYKLLKYLSEQQWTFDVADQTLNFYADGKLILMFGLYNE